MSGNEDSINYELAMPLTPTLDSQSMETIITSDGKSRVLIQFGDSDHEKTDAHEQIHELGVNLKETVSDHEVSKGDTGEAKVASSVYEKSMFNPLALDSATEDPDQDEARSIVTGMSAAAWLRANSSMASAPSSMELSSAWTTGSSARTAATMPTQLSGAHASIKSWNRERERERDRERLHDHYQARVREWNISTLPVWKPPGSPANRLFAVLKETRPGREPKALLEILDGPPPLRRRPRRTSAARSPESRRLASWNPSTQTSPPKSRSSENSRGAVPKRQGREEFGHIQSAASKKVMGSGSRSGSRIRGQQPKHPVPKWNLSTLPIWKPNSVKFRQFENFTEKQQRLHLGRRIRSRRYKGVKAQYLKPSKKYLRLREERELEAQRRETYQRLDVKYHCLP